MLAGTEQNIRSFSAECDAAANTQPQVRGDGTPVPELERMQLTWAPPQKCEHCDLWLLPEPPAGYGLTTPETLQADHNCSPVEPEQQPARISELELRVTQLEQSLGLEVSENDSLIARLARLETLL